MKKQLFILGAAALLLSACSDSVEVRNIKGGYHYKTSGQVTISGESDIYQPLASESGTLEVVSLHNDDELLITFNQTNGDVYSTKGTVSKDVITFEPCTRTLKVEFEQPISSTGGSITLPDLTTKKVEVFDIKVSGKAEVYDNNLIFTLDYDGKSESSDKTIRGEGIRMIAKKNK